MNFGKGLAIAVASWASFAVGDVFVKLLNEAEIGAVEIVFLYLIGNIVGMLSLMRKKNWQELQNFIKTKPVIAFFMAVFFVTSCILSCYAFALLPIPEVYVFFFMAPVVTFCVARILLREHIPLKRWLVVFAAFSGIVIAYYGDLNFSGNELNPMGLLCCGITVLCLALNVTLLRYVKLSPQSMTLWPSIFGIIVCPFIMDSSFSVLAERSFAYWDYVLAIMFTSAFGNLLRCEACRIAPASIVAVTHYSQMPIGIIAGLLVWSRFPSLSMLIGAVVIIASGAALIKSSEKEQESEAVN